MVEKIRWGVIGAGGIARRRTIPGMLMAEHAQLVSVMNPKIGDAEEIRAEFGAEKAYDSEAALLDDPDIDAVYIASPVVYHASQARLAADYGKHILLEKPIAMTCSEGEELLRYCYVKGVSIGAGLMMRFATHIRNMKQAVAEGKIGQVVSGFSRFTNWLPAESGMWLQQKKLAGGGCMMDMGVHTIDLMEYITGMKATAVSSMNETVTFDYDVEDTSTLLIRMENGAQCVVQTNFNIPDEAADWTIEFFGTRGKLIGDSVIGQDDAGTLRALYIENSAAYDAMQVHRADSGIILDGEFGNLYEREIESFSLSLINGTPLEVPASDALHVQRIMEAAYRSSEKNITVIL